MDFIVVDTEGRKELTEIAIVNSAGQVIYEALNQEHPEYLARGIPSKPLKTILLDFTAIAHNKVLVFHNADHDLKVLTRSFQKADLVQKQSVSGRLHL